MLEELLLSVELPELERIWLKHDLGCALFELLSGRVLVNDESREHHDLLLTDSDSRPGCLIACMIVAISMVKIT
jgi:hypothetical protein